MSEDRKQLRNLAKRATPGPWELQTSNSWRRIGTTGGRFADGDVLAPTTHRGDNHPDLAARQEDLEFIVAANPAAVLAMLDEIDRLKADNAALEKRLCICQECGGRGEVHTGEYTYEGEWQPPEPVMVECGECGGDGQIGGVQDLDAVIIERDQLVAEKAELKASLAGLFDEYKAGADSGDWGHWRVEETEAGQVALRSINRLIRQEPQA